MARSALTSIQAWCQQNVRVLYSCFLCSGEGALRRVQTDLVRKYTNENKLFLLSSKVMLKFNKVESGNDHNVNN